MEDGLVTVGHAGACVWADDVGRDADLALLAGASITFRTGFTGERL